MILLVSGEGPTDIGAEAPPPEEGVRWGPMARLIDQIVEPIWNYSPIDSSAMVFISKQKLVTEQKASRVSRLQGITLPGVARPQETAYFFHNARTLARMAAAEGASQSCPAGAVLFRDADGTVSSGSTLRQDKVRSIEDGFAAEAFSYGVPMVPNPKSEVWLLCALQANAYQNCARFETISGNDNSQRSAKTQLAEAREAHPHGSEDPADLVARGVIDAHRINMPSFNEFRERVEEVAKALRSTSAIPEP